MTSKEEAFDFALSSNKEWASFKAHQNPEFFNTLAKGQTPSILWIGCSDSRVPETTILGLNPGDIFVHRNIANIVSPTDLALTAVLEYAIQFVKVTHVVLCGHSACGGCIAALGADRVGGVLDTWLSPLKTEKKTHSAELESIKDDGERALRLSEINVEKGVEVLLGNWTVEQGIRNGTLSVHGVVFDLKTGLIKNLGVGSGKAAAVGVADEVAETK